MDNPLLKKHITYLIIPFTYRKPFKTIPSIPFFTVKKLTNEKVFDHIASLINHNENDKTTIGKAFELEPNDRSKLGLPEQATCSITYQVKEHTFEIKIDGIDLYLFDTQVGFLVYHIITCGQKSEVDFEKQVTIHDLILTNYYIKQVFKQTNKMYFINDTNGKMTIDFKDLTKTVTKTLAVDSYFEEMNQNPNHVLLYTGAYLQGPMPSDEKDFAKYLYYLRKAYKNTYLPTKYDLNLEDNPDIYQPFENSYWGFSLEGVANLSLETGNHTTDDYFADHFFNNIEKTYFYLYLLLLQQKYSLLKMSVNAGVIHNTLDGKNFSEQISIINHFKQEIVDFTVRGLYEQVSYITHHAELYEKIKNRLGIDSLYKELKSELDALSSFIEVAADKDERAKEEMLMESREKTNILIQVITLLFLPITAITGFFGMNVDFLKGKDEYFYYSAIILYVTAFFGFYIIRKNNRR